MGSYSQGAQKSGGGFGPGRDTGSTVLAQQVTIVAAAVASQDFTAYLPDGAILDDVIMDTTVAPTGTTAVVSGGTTLGGTEVWSATDVKATPRTRPTFTVAQLAVTQALPDVAGQSDTPVYIRLAQTGPTAVGTIVVTLLYHLTRD